MAGGQALLYGNFAFAAEVPVRGVKIIEAAGKAFVRHPAYLGGVYLVTFHRQTHTPKAEILFDIFKILHNFLLGR